jgi:thioredoxin 1
MIDIASPHGYDEPVINYKSMSATIVTNENFEAEVIKSELPVIIDFWAEWCGPCKVLSPIIEELAKEYEGKIKVAKVNVDEQPELSSTKFQIMSIPTMKFFKGGLEVDELIGAAPKQSIEEKLKKMLA